MEDKNKVLQELLQKAEVGIRETFESDAFQNYLKTMAKFHDYSPRNILLILLQKPEATYVAGYQKWRKELGRNVKKGEKGIKIIAYTPIERYDEVPKKDAQGTPVLDPNGLPVYTVQKTVTPKFQVKHVFDISQTEGNPLPTLKTRIDGEVKNYDAVYESMRMVSDFDVSFEPIKGGALGYCSNAEQKIVIKPGMSQLQNIAVLVHEIAHEKMHFSWEGKQVDNDTKEVEAEATAYAVCEYLGMDTSEVAFPYVASWSRDRELSQLHESLQRIQKCANTIITDYEEHYLDIVKGMNEIAKNKAKHHAKEREE